MLYLWSGFLKPWEKPLQKKLVIATYLEQYVTLYHKPHVKLVPDQFGFIANLETACSEL